MTEKCQAKGDCDALNESDDSMYFTRLVDALEYIQAMKIIHRDVRLENVLLNNRQVKLDLSR